jgi:hypothetical protein
MKFNFEEKMSLAEEETTKMRKEYEDNAQKTARNQNTIIENLAGTKTAITKEDVIEIDAHMENDARTLLKRGKMSEKEFKNLVTNSLEYSTSKLNAYEGPRWSKIKGTVNGIDVELKVKWINGGNQYDRNHPSFHPKDYEGEINGKPLSGNDAKKLYEELIDIIDKRQEQIDLLKGERVNEKEMSGFMKNEEKRIANEKNKDSIQKSREEQARDEINKIL